MSLYDGRSYSADDYRLDIGYEPKYNQRLGNVLWTCHNETSHYQLLVENSPRLRELFSGYGRPETVGYVLDWLMKCMDETCETYEVGKVTENGWSTPPHYNFADPAAAYPGDGETTSAEVTLYGGIEDGMAEDVRYALCEMADDDAYGLSASDAVARIIEQTPDAPEGFGDTLARIAADFAGRVSAELYGSLDGEDVLE